MATIDTVRALSRVCAKAGRARLSRRVAKGILDRLRAMTTDERADEFNLRALGLSPEEARALAMSGNGKAPKRKPVYGKPVGKMGPTLAEQSGIGHAYGISNPDRRQARLARRQARRLTTRLALQKGGPGSGPRPGGGGHTALSAQSHLDAAHRHLERSQQARAAGDHVNAEKHAQLAHDRLSSALQASRQRLTKTRVQKKSSLDDAYIQTAFGAQRQPLEHQDSEDPPQNARYLDAQRLVSGMDAESEMGAPDAASARARASANLAANMGRYDYIGRTADTALHNVGGLNLDLFCGASRKRGFLGVDTFPHDYGTVIADLNMGIPFPDGSVRAIRLPSVTSFSDHKKAFTVPFLDMQRALAQGGRIYLSNLDGLDNVDWNQLPGLAKVTQTSTGGMVIQRIPAKLPLVYGSDTAVLHANERTPADLALAMAAFGPTPPAATAMANLVQKRHLDIRARVLKKVDWQRVVLGAVLVPEELDAHNDLISAEQIEKTAHDFLVNARVVGKQHTQQWNGAEVVESYIAPIDMHFSDPVYGDQTIPKGTWMLGVRLPENDWQSVLDGSFTGFSVGGWGDRLAA